MAFDGTTFMVAWADGQTGRSYGARVSSDGVVLDPDGISISSRGGSGSVGFDGTNYLVPWVPGQSAQTGRSQRDPRDYRGRRDRPRRLSIGRQAPSEQVGPAVASTARTSSPSGRTTAPATPTSTRRGSPSRPVARRNGNRGRARRTATGLPHGHVRRLELPRRLGGSPVGRRGDIYGARVSRTGTVLDPGGFPISARIGVQGDAAVTSDGSTSLVVWDPLPPKPRSRRRRAPAAAASSPAGEVRHLRCTGRPERGRPRPRRNPGFHGEPRPGRPCSCLQRHGLRRRVDRQPYRLRGCLRREGHARRPGSGLGRDRDRHGQRPAAAARRRL